MEQSYTQQNTQQKGKIPIELETGEIRFGNPDYSRTTRQEVSCC